MKDFQNQVHNNWVTPSTKQKNTCKKEKKKTGSTTDNCEMRLDVSKKKNELTPLGPGDNYIDRLVDIGN